MEQRQRPVVIQGELAERLLRGMESTVGLAKDMAEMQRDMREALDTLRGTREYDGLVARFREMERDLKALREDLTEHRKACGEDKRDRRVSRWDWYRLWVGILVSIALALFGLAQHAPPHPGH